MDRILCSVFWYKLEGLEFKNQTLNNPWNIIFRNDTSCESITFKPTCYIMNYFIYMYPRWTAGKWLHYTRTNSDFSSFLVIKKIFLQTFRTPSVNNIMSLTWKLLTWVPILHFKITFWYWPLKMLNWFKFLYTFNIQENPLCYAKFVIM